MTKTIALTVDVEEKYLDELPKLIAILDKRNIKATFFVPAVELAANKKFFLNLQNKGHEIALHGYLHERWDTMNSDKKYESLNTAIAWYKQIFKVKPRGWRTPQFSIDNELAELLDREDFKYDSSLMKQHVFQSIFFPSRLFLYLKQMFLKFEIKEIPVSSCILPTSLFTLKRVPFLFYLSCSLRNKIVILTHSYELDDERLKLLENVLNKYKDANFVKMEDFE